MECDRVKEDYTMTNELLNDLEKLAAHNMLPLERRLCDTAIWFHRNKGCVPIEDLGKRLEFAEKTIDIMLELFALTLDRMQRLEGKGKSPNLYLPNGIRLRG